MVIPAPAAPIESAWESLDPEAKRARVLERASALFAREGLHAPMSAVATEVGVGVGSLYRQLGSKDDIVAALVVERLDEMREVFAAGEGDPDPLAGLSSATMRALERCARDHVIAEAFEVLRERPDIQTARQDVHDAIEVLLARARAAGAIRADATALDIRLLLIAARHAERSQPESWRRMHELFLAGLRP